MGRIRITQEVESNVDCLKDMAILYLEDNGLRDKVADKELILEASKKWGVTTKFIEELMDCFEFFVARLHEYIKEDIKELKLEIEELKNK